MTEHVMEYDGWAEGIPVGEYLKVRDAMHSRKREEVVRCRDCIFALGTASKRAKTVACTHFITLDSFENPVPSDVEPDGYCAWGKRKESE